jgi:anti-anti-sigma factor
MLSSVRKNAIDAPLDLTQEAVRSFMADLTDLIESRPPSVLIDCTRLENIASSHITVLWQSRQACEDAGIPMLLVSPSQNLLRVLRLLDLTEFFRYENPEYAESFSDLVPPTSEGVNLGLEKFLRYLVTVQASDRVLFELRTIYYEVMTNIRTHSDENLTESIQVTVRANHEEIELVFTDSGPAFNPTDHISDFDPRVSSRRGQTRGFGITMISRLATRMSYVRRGDNTNVLTVLKQR